MMKGFLLLLSLLGTQAYLSPVADDNIPLNTTEGVNLLLTPSTLNWPYFLTLIHLPTQKTQTYCSVASSVMVLNSLASDRAPVDPAYDPYAYWTQDNFFTNCTGAIKDQITVTKMGATLEELEKMLSCHNVTTKIIFGSEVSLDEFRDILKASMTVPQNNKPTYVLANFHRTEVGEEGGGHFSPLIALNPDEDMVLIADVTRYKYAPTWVSVTDLYNSVNTVDNASGKSRGLMLMS